MQDELVAELNQDSNPRLYKLNEALGSLIEDFSLVGFVPLCASLSFCRAPLCYSERRLHLRSSARTSSLGHV